MHLPGKKAYVIGSFSFGQHNTSNSRLATQSHVVVKPFTLHAVHADQYRMSGRQPSPDRSARCNFFCRRHRIFQIDDHRVGSRRTSLCKSVRAVTWNEQIRASYQYWRPNPGK